MFYSPRALLNALSGQQRGAHRHTRDPLRSILVTFHAFGHTHNTERNG